MHIRSRIPLAADRDGTGKSMEKNTGEGLWITHDPIGTC